MYLQCLFWIAESSKRNEKVLIRHLFGCLQMVYGLCVPGMLLPYKKTILDRKSGHNGTVLRRKH